jgi:beta-barrel assembly-enhancing protease
MMARGASRRRRVIGLGFVFALFLSFSGKPARAGETPDTFKFTKIDLEFLDKANQADREFDRRGLVFNDPDTNAYVEEIGRKMVPDTPLENVTWRFRVLREAEPNAFALPNGSIYLNIGLLALLRNEAQLASVLGHEATHVVNRHGYLENRSYRKKMAAANILSAIGGLGGNFGGIGGAVAGSVLGAIVPGVTIASIYGYSRELEREADAYGLRAMARNNYPPIQMAATFEQLKSGYEVQLDKEARGLYADHPRLDDRIKYVEETVETLPALSGPPIVRDTEYSRQMRQVMRHDVQLEILSERARTALGVATRLTELDPDSSESFYLLGEAYRALGGRTPRPRAEELTGSAKGATRKQLNKMTPVEYEKALRATPEGKAAWDANVASAETAYTRALTLEPQNARAVRGLAALYDSDGKTTQALEGYHKYLELAPTAMDAYRIKKRAEELEKISAAAPEGARNPN